ncbi:MAG: NTP transferase domain-containing protein [Candidatus Pacearchaeota archaeon]
MEYKVCILAAGVGGRMKEFSEHLNKVLLPLKGKPTICHIIEMFPDEIEIVIAVGYKKEGLVTYLKTAYPERKLTFVEVNPYIGEGSGPGFSLYSCKNHLMCPFIHVAGDTLVIEEIPEPEENWLGVAEVANPERFCSVKIDEEGIISRIDDKVKNDNEHAYIGLLGVKDYDIFWDALEKNKTAIKGEIQVSNGLQALLKEGLKSKTFSWFDTGTPESYSHAMKNYPDGESYTGE